MKGRGGGSLSITVRVCCVRHDHSFMHVCTMLMYVHIGEFSFTAMILVNTKYSRGQISTYVVS